VGFPAIRDDEKILMLFDEKKFENKYPIA